MPTVVRFDEILLTWQTDGQAIQAGRVKSMLDAYISCDGNCRQICENLDSDPSLGRRDKTRFLEELGRHCANSADPVNAVREFLVRFCRRHQLKGRKRVAAQRSWLGHVLTEEKLRNLLGSAVSSTSMTTLGRARPAGPAVEDVLQSDLFRQQEVLRYTRLGNYQTWSCYQPRHPGDPFWGVLTSASELRRRLGLGHLPDPARDPDVKLLWWVHSLQEPEQLARVPTAFDAADNHYFRPGGKTRPLDGASDGLREVVHEPVFGWQLEQPIARAY